jgi:cell division protein FtsB
MKEEILTKVLLKLLKQNKELKQEVEYISEFIVLLNDKLDFILKKNDKKSSQL